MRTVIVTAIMATVWFAVPTLIIWSVWWAAGPILAAATVAAYLWWAWGMTTELLGGVVVEDVRAAGESAIRTVKGGRS